MKKPFLLIILLFCTRFALAQIPQIQRVDPTNWWVGLKNPNLQLLVYGPNAGTLTYSVKYPGVKLVKSHKVENKNYAFLDLVISPATKAGTLQLIGTGGGQTLTRAYELKARDNQPKGQGLTSADFIYLLMPDRLAGPILPTISLPIWPIKRRTGAARSCGMAAI